MKAAELRQQQLKAMRENADFLPEVVKLFHQFGWKVHHIIDSAVKVDGRWVAAKRIGPGFPDLVLAHPKLGIIYAELKAEDGKLSDKQEEWIALLNAAAKAVGLRGRPAVVWKPSDWDRVVDIAQRGLRHVEAS